MTRSSLGVVAGAAALLVLGIWSLSSAGMLDQSGANNLVKHMAAAAVGLVCALFFAWVDYRRWNRGWWIGAMYALTVALLVAVLVLGREINGARRWVFNIQPSEVTKLTVILSLAWFCSRFRHRLGSWRHVIGGAGVMVVPLLLLILKEPDRGTTLLLAVLATYLLLVAGARWQPIAIAGVVGVVLLGAVLASDPLVRARVEAWLGRGPRAAARSEQNELALRAFGEGGVTGKGLGAGTMMRTIPERNTDFILPVIGEELGLVGTLSVVAAFGCILVCGSAIARRAAVAGETFGLLIAAGTTFLVTFQAWTNIAVVTRMIPNKGLGLPFVSRGGSNLLIMFILVGLLLSVDRHTPRTGLSTRRRLGWGRNPFTERSDELAFGNGGRHSSEG